GETISRRRSIARGCAVMPAGTVVDGMAPSVVQVKADATYRLHAQRSLQRVVVRVSCIEPRAQLPVVGVQCPTSIDGDRGTRIKAGVALPEQVPAKVIHRAGSYRQQSAGNTVDVFSPEQLVPGRADIVQLHHHFRNQFVLQAEIVVVNVGVANAFREDQSAAEGKVRIVGIPSHQIPHILHSYALSRIGSAAAFSSSY